MTSPVPPAPDNPDRPGPPKRHGQWCEECHPAAQPVKVVIPPERVIYAELLSREELAAAMLHDSLMWGATYVVWRSADPSIPQLPTDRTHEDRTGHLRNTP